MMLEDFLQSLGHEVSGSCDSVGSALEAKSSKGEFDLAILDVNLKGESVWPVAARAARSGIPFVLASGGHVDPPPAEFASVPMIEKPYTIDRVTPVSKRRCAELGVRSAAQAARSAGFGRCFVATVAARHDLVSRPSCCSRPTRSAAGPLAAGRGAARTSTPPDGEQLHGVHIPPRGEPRRSRDSDPRLWRQCLERAGRRRPICTRSIPKRDVVAFHYRGYRAVDRQSVGRGAARRCAAGLRFRGRAGQAGTHRRGRLQHRQRRRREPAPATASSTG